MCNAIGKIGDYSGLRATIERCGRGLRTVEVPPRLSLGMVWLGGSAVY